MLRNTTKMGIQAAVAIAIAEVISHSLHFERGYWITLTAMALITQTWGESVKRSFERVGMTILGGSVGTAIYFFLPPEPMLILALLLLFVFLTAYMMPIYHLIAVFFLTCFVVFLFALIGHWDWFVLRARIVDTVIGAMVALTVGNFLFPLKTNVTSMFSNYLHKLNASLSMVFNYRTVRTFVSSQSLMTDFHNIKKDALAIRYELLFHRLNTRDFNLLLIAVGGCSHYAMSLIEAYQWLSCRLCEEEIAIVHKAAKDTEKNIENLICLLNKEKEIQLSPATDFSDLLQKEIDKSPGRFATLESDALGFYSLLYFFTQLNVYLSEVFNLLKKEHL